MTPPSDWAAAQRRNLLALALWTAAWVATLALASFGARLLWDGHVPLTVAALALNVAVGVGMVFANKRYLQGLDELQRRIQLEAMAVSLGAGMVGGLAYSTLDVTNVIGFHAEIAHLVVGMSLAYLAAVAAGSWRYA